MKKKIKDLFTFENGLILFVICLIGFILHKEIIQTMKQRKMCNDYSLSVQDYREGCKF